MRSVDQIIHAAYVVHGDQLQVLTDHAVIIDNGVIVDIMPSTVVAAVYTAARVESLPNAVLMPGLVNSHTHIGMNLFRGLADDLDLQTWLNQHIWPAEHRHVSAELVYDASLLAAAEMIKGGTTACNEMYFFPQDTARAIVDAGMRAHIGMTIIDFPSPWAPSVEDYWRIGTEFYEQYRNHELITVTLAPHAVYTVGQASLMRVRDFAQQHDLGITMHVQETAQEITECMNATGQRPVAYLAKLGLLNNKFMAIHMTQINDEDIEILQDTKAHIVHCPESNMKLSSGICPGRQLLDSGVNLALGTDSVASNNDLDMIGEMRSAALLAKVASNDPQALSARDVLTMATRNGARCLGGNWGSLTIGRSADMVAFDLATIEMQPVYDVIAQIVYAGNRTQVTDVWVAGRRLLQQRRLTTLDEESLLLKAQAWRQRIMSHNA